MNVKKIMPFVIVICLISLLCGCSASATGGKRIIRIAHVQNEQHPIHLGLAAFENYIEERLGDKYDVQIYPNELLGAQVKTVELCQTGAVDFTVASISILESFDNVYEIFNLPYLFDSEEHYYSIMEDEKLINPIFESTSASGFQGVAWYDAGTRNFYTVKKPVETPEDLKGLKIRVQQSATNVKMMELFNAAATPMSFGEVYTALQQNVIDGAENNELALINNKHGEVAKHYSYNKHQMVPDILIGNVKFLESLEPEDRKIFEEGFKVSTQIQRENWAKAVDEAKKEAEKMGVKFYYPDAAPFKEKVIPLHNAVIENNEKLPKIYEAVQKKGDELRGDENEKA